MTAAVGFKPSYTQRLASSLASLSALSLLPWGAQADIIYHNTPLSLGVSDAPGTSVGWDVDGNGVADFQLYRGSSHLSLNSVGLPNGKGFVAPGTATYTNWHVQRLAPGFVVGPSLARYGWGNTNSSHTMLATNPLAIAGPFSSFSAGDNFLGFRFTDGTSTFYGWATLNLDLLGGIATIKGWAYNDTPDAPITAIPEPSAASLVLLGLGVGGLRAFRARKKAAAQSA